MEPAEGKALDARERRKCFGRRLGILDETHSGPKIPKDLRAKAGGRALAVAVTRYICKRKRQFQPRK